MSKVEIMNMTKLILLTYITIILTACSTLPTKNNTNDTELEVYIFAEDDINPNLLAEPSPLRLSILQLSTEVEFNQMNELTLTDTYKNHLGESVVEEMSVTVRPEDQVNFKLPLNDKANYIGVVAAYRELDKNWKMSLYKQDKKWYQKGGNFLYLDVKNNGVTQLTKKEAMQKILDKKMAEQGKNLDELSKKQKKKLKESVEKIMDGKKPADLKKGLYMQSTGTE